MLIMPHGSVVEHTRPFRSAAAVRKELTNLVGPVNVLQMASMKDINRDTNHYMAFDAASAVTTPNAKATRLYAASHPDERPARVIVGPVVIYPETDVALWNQP